MLWTNVVIFTCSKLALNFGFFLQLKTNYQPGDISKLLIETTESILLWVNIFNDHISVIIYITKTNTKNCVEEKLRSGLNSAI